MNLLRHAWTPAVVLGLGALLLVFGTDVQRELPLREPLAATIPDQIGDYAGRDVVMTEEEERVAGMTSYLLRMYEPAAAAGGRTPFSLYVGYYESQTHGKTIHSPRNCLPGSGWEPLSSSKVTLTVPAGAITVNRYLLRRGNQQALVLYWYQGRGRVEADEYRVKLDLLRDAALRGRSDEALVRIMVPLTTSEEDALRLASRIADVVVPSVYTALPG